MFDISELAFAALVILMPPRRHAWPDTSRGESFGNSLPAFVYCPVRLRKHWMGAWYARHRNRVRDEWRNRLDRHRRDRGRHRMVGGIASRRFNEYGIDRQASHRANMLDLHFDPGHAPGNRRSATEKLSVRSERQFSSRFSRR